MPLFTYHLWTHIQRFVAAKSSKSACRNVCIFESPLRLLSFANSVQRARKKEPQSIKECPSLALSLSHYTRANYHQIHGSVTSKVFQLRIQFHIYTTCMSFAILQMRECICRMSCCFWCRNCCNDIKCAKQKKREKKNPLLFLCVRWKKIIYALQSQR